MRLIAEGSGGRLRKAMPSATVRINGKPKVQKTAPGSRKKSRMRDERQLEEGSAARRPFAQLPAGEVDEHVLERRPARDTRFSMPSASTREDLRQRHVQLLDREEYGRR